MKREFEKVQHMFLSQPNYDLTSKSQAILTKFKPLTEEMPKIDSLKKKLNIEFLNSRPTIPNSPRFQKSYFKSKGVGPEPLKPPIVPHSTKHVTSLKKKSHNFGLNKVGSLPDLDDLKIGKLIPKSQTPILLSGKLFKGFTTCKN